MNKSLLTLYYLEECRFCQKVIEHFDRNGMEYCKKETSEPQIREELQQIGGKTQVPCVVKDGQAMYESAEIIRNYS